MIFVTSFNRPELLLRLLKELQGEDVIVIDDGSDYDPSEHIKVLKENKVSLDDECEQYYRWRHQGKKNFWRIWDDMLGHAEQFAKDGEDEFIFLQDDLYNVDLEGLRAVETPDKYALNLMDVGPDRGWSPKNYVDCIFKTNRATLEQIGWSIDPVPKSRWKFRPTLSSGVGKHLSQAFYKNQIPMILPDQNYASHGKVESKMHKQERKQNPLICETGE